jgi:hypothetical protein
LFQQSAERSWTIIVLVLGALILAYLLGYAIAFQETSGDEILLIIGGVLVLAATLFAPIEVMILAGMLGTMLADSRIIPGSLVYYARFVPMGMLAIRTFTTFLVRRNPNLPLTRSFVFPVLPILLLAFASAIYGIEPEKIFQRAVSMLFVVVSFGIGLPSFWQTRERTEQGLKWVASLLIVVLTIGFVLFDLNPQYAFYEYEYVRLHGIFGGPNTQGLIAMMAVFPVAWWWHTEKQPLRKLLLGLAVLLVIGEVIAAGSRASFLGVVVGTVGCVWLSGQFSPRNLLLLSFGALILILLVLFEPNLARVLQFSSDSDRVFLWQRSVELGMDSPIWGVGLGASDLIYAADKPYLLSIGKATGGSHSSYFRMFVDLGIVGVLLGFWVFIIILAKTFTAPQKIRRDAMVAFLAATVLAGLVNAAFEDWLFGFGSASTPILWFALALLALRVEMLEREQSPLPAPVQLKRIRL